MKCAKWMPFYGIGWAFIFAATASVMRSVCSVPLGTQANVMREIEFNARLCKQCTGRHWWRMIIIDVYEVTFERLIGMAVSMRVCMCVWLMN